MEKLGLGVPGVYYGVQLPQRFNLNQEVSQDPKALEYYLSDKGELAIHISFTCIGENRISDFDGRLESSDGHIQKMKAYPFDTHLEVEENRFTGRTASFKQSVLVVWLDQFDEKTSLKLSVGNKSKAFTIATLLKDHEGVLSTNEINAAVSLLSYHETGLINPEHLGISPPADNYMFCVMADTQGGDPTDPSNDSPTRMKIHNAFIEESVRLVNQQDNPLFNIVIGDIVDSKGQWSNFRKLLEFLGEVKCPTFFTVGNHETAYNVTFPPEDRLSGFTNFFKAQDQMNGMDELLYSFNLGEWHFIAWPDPLRNNFWELHPHYFDWLENDLEVHASRPTVFFHHVPVTPIGIDPLVSYVEPIYVRNLLINILAKHGNVKYALSGHVHIPIKSSFKTAFLHKGIKFINLPAAGYRPRAFGEPDFDGRPSQGIGRMNVSGREATLEYVTVTGEVYRYDDYNEFTDSLWNIQKWDLPLNKTLMNGSFASGLDHWHQQYVYQEDIDPSNVREVVTLDSNPESALHLFSSSRGFPIPGQDRLPQSINYIAQAVALDSSDSPSLAFQIKPLSEETLDDSYNGIYLWIEGLSGRFKRLNLVYSFGKILFQVGGKYADIAHVKPIHYNLPLTFDNWNEVRINVNQDYEKVSEASFKDLHLDRLVINLGSWTVNDGNSQKAGALLTDLVLDRADKRPGHGNGKVLSPKASENIWYGGIDHIAGEHIYKT